MMEKQQALLVVNFDLDQGQTVELCHPGIFSKDELNLLAMQAFPDNNELQEGQAKLVFTFWQGSTCLLGVSCFVRRKEPTAHRGYSQRTFVAISRDWKLLGLQNAAMSMAIASQNPQKQSFLETMKSISISEQQIVDQTFCHLQKDKDLEHLMISQQLFQHVELFDHLPVKDVQLIWGCWEMVLTNSPLILQSSSSQKASYLTLWLTSAIWPLHFMGQLKPYMTVYDAHYETLREMVVKKARPNILAGVSNPLFGSQFKGIVLDLDQPPPEWFLKHNFQVKPSAMVLSQIRGSKAAQKSANSAFMRSHFRRLTLEFIKPIACFVKDGGRTYQQFQSWTHKKHFGGEYVGAPDRTKLLYEKFFMSKNMGYLLHQLNQ